MNTTKTEYRSIDWALIGIDYLLQHIERGETRFSAMHAFDSYMYDRLQENLSEEDFRRVMETVRRIAHLAPTGDRFGAVAWIDEDIEQELENAEIEITDDHIAAVKQRAMKRDRLREAQIDAGWAVIQACINELYGKED